jgi:hypothetical protein
MRSREHLLRVLENDYPSFRAHLLLGKIYLRQDRVARAVEELHCAREIDPHRFAREGFPGDPLLWIAERLPEARVRQNLVVPGPGSQSTSAADRDRLSYPAPVEELPFGDFLNRAEAERFAALPPISLADLEDVDWDELVRDLTDEEPL